MPEQAHEPGSAENYGARVRTLARHIVTTASSEPVIAAAIEHLNALPQPGCEAWKYSPVNRLYDALAAEADSLTASSATDACDLLKLVDNRRYPLAVMSALVLRSSSRKTARQDEQIELAAPGEGHHWQHIDVPANTRATLIQRSAPSTGSAVITTVSLAEGATLEHSLIGSPDAGTQWQLLAVNQQANSTYTLHQLSLGGHLERIDVHVRLLGEAATAALTGALLCGSNDRCDTQTVLEHAAPRCSSTARYHGLANHTGKLTFGGRIHILETGPGTDARLHNPNLLLSDAAEINTKPELEIYNDDVACAHGATIGQLDEDAIFYLRSRGINSARANALLLRGFVSDVMGGPDAEQAINLTRQRLEEWTL